MWVGTDAGLSRYEPATDDFVNYGAGANGAGFTDVRIRVIREDHAGALWIGTLGSGLNRLDPDTDRVTSFRHDPAVAGSLSNDRVQAMLEDDAQAPVGRDARWPESVRSRFRKASFATAATPTIRRACATTTSCRCIRIAAECSGSARATAAPVTGIRTAGCSATIAVLRSAARGRVRICGGRRGYGVGRNFSRPHRDRHATRPRTASRARRQGACAARRPRHVAAARPSRRAVDRHDDRRAAALRSGATHLAHVSERRRRCRRRCPPTA